MHSPIRLPGPALAAMQPRQGCSVRRGGAADAARKGLALTQPVPELSPCRHSWASAQSVTCCCWSLQAEYEPVTWAAARSQSQAAPPVESASHVSRLQSHGTGS